jgi:hypothetical protein
MSKEKAPAYKYPFASAVWDAQEAIIWSMVNTGSFAEWGQIVHSIMVALVNGDFEYAEQFPFILKTFHGPSKRLALSVTIKKEVLSIGRCALCGAGQRLTVDHVFPVSKGGTNDRSNLQCLCFSCNLKKSNKVL